MDNLEPISDIASETLRKLCPKPLHELGEILTDRVRLWRYKNQVAVLEEAKRFAESKGIELGPISLKTLVPMLDAAAYEDEPDLQKLWSKLLVGAGGASSSELVNRFTIDFLRVATGKELVICECAVSEIVSRNNGDCDDPDYFTLTTDSPVKPFPIRNNGTLDWEIDLGTSFLHEASGYDRLEFLKAMEFLLRYRVFEYNDFRTYESNAQLERFFRFTSIGWAMIELLSENEDLELWEKEAPEPKDPEA